MSNEEPPNSKRPQGAGADAAPRPDKEVLAAQIDSASQARAPVSGVQTPTAKTNEGSQKMSFFQRFKTGTGADNTTIPKFLELDAERVATIERLLQLDRDRVATITDLTERLTQITQASAESPGLDAQRVATIDRLMALDAQRVAAIDRFTALDADRVKTINELLERLTSADGLTMAGRNLEFLEEPVFRAAWEKSKIANAEGWPDGVPDIRMRAHLALWAARQALRLEGDFVECGVHTGLLSLVVCHALDFATLPRAFYLFDTFNGIPLDDLASAEQARGRHANAAYYRDVWEIAQRNFSPFPNARLIRGELPGTLRDAPIDKIAYLSVDLNNAVAEKAVITALWPKLVPGAAVLIDDYAWQGLEAQYDMWDDFATRVGVPIAALPTGQGLMIKPVA